MLNEAFAVDSTLDAVVVHSHGAVCTRTARLPAIAAAGVNVLEVRGLPRSLEPGSLRARIAEGPEGLWVREVRAAFAVKALAPIDLSAEQKALDEALRQEQRFKQELAGIDRHDSRLQKLKPIPFEHEKGQLPSPAPIDSLIAFGNFMQQETEALLARKQQLTVRLEELREEVQLRRRRVTEASSASQGQRTEVLRTAQVTLSDGAASSGALLVLEYVVRGARWAPAYELALEPGLSRGSLKLRAHVVQRTGEDWAQVRLSLSTAQLERRAEIPELRSLRIGRRQPPAPRSGWREPPEGLDALFAPYDSARSRLVPPAVPGHVAERIGQAQEQARRTRTSAGKPGFVVEEMESEGAPAPSGGAAGLPPPAPAPAAPPMMARAAAPPPMASMSAPAPKMAKRRSRLMEFGAKEEQSFEESELSAPEFDEADDFAPPEPEPEGALEPELDLLDYGALVLPDFAVAGRGRLQLRTEVSVHIGVQTIIDLSLREARSVQELPLPAHAVRVREAAGAFDYRYDAEHRVEVPSDGRWQMVTLGTAQVKLEPEYVTVPAIEPRVFRTLKIENQSPHALLPGPADVLLGNAFFMSVPFPLLPPQGHARLGLGVEESIKVARNTKYDESTGGLLGGASVLSHEIVIEVANRLAQPAKLEVRERVPVSNEKDVKIEEAEVKPAWFVDKEPRDGAVTEGGRAWRFVLEPGGSRQLSARYSIRIPASKALAGGNRRV